MATDLPTLVYRAEDPWGLANDFEGVLRIVDACRDAGFIVTTRDAALAYAEYSETFCATWLVLAPDQLLFECVKPYLRPAAVSEISNGE